MERGQFGKICLVQYSAPNRTQICSLHNIKHGKNSELKNEKYK